MRVVFFGGSFDPPHCGHLAIAQAALERLRLDRVVFAPVGAQPLKRRMMAPAGFADRLAMVRLALEGDPRLEVSEVDAPRRDGRPNYTVDTMADFRRTLASADELSSLMGADSFLTIKQWHRPTDLLMSCDFIAAGRPGFSLEKVEASLPPGVEFAGDWQQAAGFASRTMKDRAGRRSTLYLLPDLKVDISATEIRGALAEGSSPQTVLPAAVVAYIQRRGLYR